MNAEEDERSALIALAHGVEPGDGPAARFIERTGAVRALYALRVGRSGLAQGPGVAARLAQVHRPEEAAARVGARIIVRSDAEWPAQLNDLGTAAPLALWVLGAANLRLLALRSIAIVGARAATAYGEQTAREMAIACVEREGTVLSGGAFGIDAAAHRGALDGGGTTVCVLASGVDMPYPKGNDALIARISSEGLLVSESPLGHGPRRERFLTRNRLIAALTRGTVVVEAALRSGSASTAAAAHALNRQVLAVPGPITSPMSAGCHRMIRERQAVLMSGVADLDELLGASIGEVPREESLDASAATRSARPLDALKDARSRRVHDALPARGCRSIDELVEISGLGIADVLAGAAGLEVMGLAVQDEQGWRLT